MKGFFFCKPILSLPFLLWMLFLPFSLSAQNIFDIDHTKQFANYLFSNKQYTLAAHEFERLCFLEPTSIEYKLGLLKSLRMSKVYVQGLSKINEFFPDSRCSLPPSVGSEYFLFSVLSAKHQEATQFLSCYTGFEHEKSVNYGIALQMLQGDWQQAYLAESQATTIHPQLKEALESARVVPLKKQGVAVALSALLPGAGKVYARRWKDGLIALVIVASSSFQAYRGFHRDGVESVYGWVFTGFATGYYTGNLYGSAKAVKLYNESKINEINQLVYGAILDIE